MHSGSIASLLPPAIAFLGAFLAPSGNRNLWQEELPWFQTVTEAPAGPVVQTPGAIFSPGSPPVLPRAWSRPEASLPAVFLVHADASDLEAVATAFDLSTAPLSAESFAVWVP